MEATKNPLKAVKDQSAEETVPEFKEPTPKEIEEFKERMLNHMKEQMPFLEIQHKYETLLSEIEIARLKRISAIQQQAQLNQKMKTSDENS